MNILSINMGGTGCEEKRKSLIRILRKYRVNFVSIQETKLDKVDAFRVKSLWGSYAFEFQEALSIGRSGGIISIWDPNCFTMMDTFVFENFVVVKGLWVSLNCECFMINVYAPQVESEKLILWNKILDFMNGNKGRYLICGDFNAVRCREDRMGTVFSATNAKNFNEFIERGKLIDVAMGRHKFTRISTDGIKASRIDRFLVNQDFMDVCPDLAMEALDDCISDHRPLLFKQKLLDFGPIPFKFFNSWLQVDGFDDVIKSCWAKKIGNNSGNAFIVLKNKLKDLKADIKKWRKDRVQSRNIEHISKEIADIDLMMSKDGPNSVLANQRKDLVLELHQLNARVNLDLKQKAKIKWAVDGDENSKFFHSIIKARTRAGNIKGIIYLN